MSSLVLKIAESSQVGETRRAVNAFAKDLKLDETTVAKISIVVTEAANNIVKHASAGQIVVRALASGPSRGVEILALDRGPGMRNVADCLRDGYSTAGTPGTGLGAIVRQSTVFDVYSAPGLGTALLSQVWNRPPTRSAGPKLALELGVVNVPKSGETVCGDSWAVDEAVTQVTVLGCDGLGHGLAAADASNEAVRIFRENTARSVTDLMDATHSALRSTRGAAVAIARLDPENQSLSYVGVGNMSGAVLSKDLKIQRMVSNPGTVGHAARSIREFRYAWNPGALLVLHSDGLATRWQIEQYPGLITKHSSLIAGVLYRDFDRGNDDVTVIVAREAAA